MHTNRLMTNAPAYAASVALLTLAATCRIPTPLLYGSLAGVLLSLAALYSRAGSSHYSLAVIIRDLAFLILVVAFLNWPPSTIFKEISFLLVLGCIAFSVVLTLATRAVKDALLVDWDYRNVVGKPLSPVWLVGNLTLIFPTFLSGLLLLTVTEKSATIVLLEIAMLYCATAALMFALVIGDARWMKALGVRTIVVSTLGTAGLLAVLALVEYSFRAYWTLYALSAATIFLLGYSFMSLAGRIVQGDGPRRVAHRSPLY
jgi:hypothetical protein